jgi:hypothetical protein
VKAPTEIPTSPGAFTAPVEETGTSGSSTVGVCSIRICAAGDEVSLCACTADVAQVSKTQPTTGDQISRD